MFTAKQQKTFDVLSVADMCVDMILTGNVRPQFHQVEQIIGDCSIELGGSANIFASQMAKLGSRSGVLGWIGRDVLGDFALRELNGAGVDTSNVRRHPTLKTGIGFALSEPDDRAILAYMGTIDATQPEHLDEKLLQDCHHWHIATYFLLENLRDAWLPWLRRAKQLGVTTSLDTNWDPAKRWTGVRELLPYVDVFIPNEAEALAITGTNDVQSAAEKLAENGTLVVVKRAERGVFARKAKQTWEFDARRSGVRMGTVVDSTGAGDNFDAGFLHGWLNGSKVEECIEFGHRCAVNSLSAPGGIRGQVNVEVLRSQGFRWTPRAVEFGQ
jgi:sugar/nucleoside kinase (ribokinase family)